MKKMKTTTTTAMMIMMMMVMIEIRCLGEIFNEEVPLQKVMTW